MIIITETCYYMYLGLFAGSLCDTIGCRALCIIGTILVFIGYCIAAMANNIAWLIIGYGAVAGETLIAYYVCIVRLVGKLSNLKHSTLIRERPKDLPSSSAGGRVRLL